ncbi:BRO-N domain-containing protein [Jiella sonneratiae]|uniref:Bro-N domain-containing protein n=1 Tax=Jiella sonneratiae TaxID=2816856 RepID=A0ABS3J4S3_9HYPH|nr:BRO family protein [Jiella sonneratiae]MBO0904664.1 hypothetical protein [Jiella sonneratiae]
MTKNAPINATALSNFEFDGHTIRVVEISGEPWFVAADNCRALGVYVRSNGSTNVNAATTKLDSEESMNMSYREAKRIGLQSTASRSHGIKLISESGLYKLIMRSDKALAKPF